jgi:hypothetical protein
MAENGITSGSIFCQPWWLDAVAPGQWKEIIITKDNQELARMPYVMKTRWGFKIISMPPLTQHLGPILQISAEKYVTRLSEEKKLIYELIDILPRFDYFRQRFHYSISNWLPFYWRGFKQTTHYTYVIEQLSDLDAVYQALRKNTRSDIRRAAKRVIVRDDLDINRFININELTFKRQDKKLPYDRDLILRLDTACDQHNARKILFAEDAKGRIHAAGYFVWDTNSAYYLMSGIDPDLHSSGAMSLLIWEAIKFAATVTKKFDFEGSMVEPIERFFRSFGAVQKPYFQISKVNSLILKVGEEVQMWKNMRNMR